LSFYLRQTALVDDGPALDAAGLIHRVRQPMTAGPHPTIVMLHGMGGSEDSTWLMGPALPRQWLVTAPRGIEAGPGGRYAWVRRVPDEWPGLAEYDEAVRGVARFAAALPSLYGADPDRTFLLGFSQGAATSFATSIAKRDAVSGIASVVGFVPTDCGDERLLRLAELPVFMAVGRRDPLIPFEVSAVCAATLRSVGADLEYHEYDVGHKLSSQGMRDLRGWWERQV